jgi:imidazolonepropionase-like amidohydrolase
VSRFQHVKGVFMKIRQSISGLSLILCFAFCHLASEGQITAIKAGKLVDPETGKTAVNQIILVENRRIKSIGPGLPIPAGAVVIDLTGMTVLPGVFDAHSHLCYTNTPEERKQFHLDMEQTTAYRAIEGTRNAKDMLESGFTTVRDVGNNGRYGDTALRQAIERDVVPGPTIINAGRIIAPFGGQYQLQPDRPELGNPEYLYADTHDEMIKAIRENIHYGALVIKIVVDDQKYIYTAEDIKFIVDEVHRAHLKVAAHCMTTEGARNAALGGVDSIEHGFAMTDEVLKLAKDRGVVLVGTDFPEKAAGYLGQGPDFPKFFHGVFLDRLKRAYKVGITMAYGTDTFFAVPAKLVGP